MPLIPSRNHVIARSEATWQSILLSPPWCDLPGIGCWRCNISEKEALKINHCKSGLGQGLLQPILETRNLKLGDMLTFPWVIYFQVLSFKFLISNFKFPSVQLLSKMTLLLELFVAVSNSVKININIILI